MGFGSHGHSHGQSHGHSHENHNHHHGHSHEKKSKFCGCCHLSEKFRLSSMLGMTFLFFLVELVIGQITKSVALTTDAFHMLSDTLALFIGLFSVIIAKKKSTKNTFGWVRAEVLGPLINSVFLISLCFGIAIEAIERLFEGKNIDSVHLLLVTGCIGLGINLVGLFLFGHAHSHNIPHIVESDESENDESEDEEVNNLIHTITIPNEMDKEEKDNNSKNKMTEESLLVVEPPVNIIKKAQKSPKKSGKSSRSIFKCNILSSNASMNMRAVFLHVLADALGSVIVIISALLNMYQAQLKIPQSLTVYIDPVLCLLLVILILSSTIPLLKESALILLQTVPKEIKIKKLEKDIVKKIPGILAVHELHVWKLSGNKIIATAHVKCHNSFEYMKIATDLKSFFHKKGIHSTTIQPEFTDAQEGVPFENCILECRNDCNPNKCCDVKTGETTAKAPKLVTKTSSSNIETN